MNTINYSEMTGSFMSFMSYSPVWHLNFGERYYSFDSSNDMYFHDSNSLANMFSGLTPDESNFRFVINGDYLSTKVFDNMSFSADFTGNDTFTNIIFNTDSQTSETVSVALDEREDTYKFAIPREAQDSDYASRMRGKYMVGSFTFQSTSGNYFTLPAIETTYRYSNI